MSFTPSGIFNSPQVVAPPKMSSTTPLVPKPSVRTRSITATMLATGRYSDLVLICKGKKFQVHKAVVCLQCKPISAAIDQGFKEGVDGKFEFEDEESEIAEMFVKFLYLADYNDGSRKPEITALTKASVGHASHYIRMTHEPFTSSGGRIREDWWKSLEAVSSSSTSGQTTKTPVVPEKKDHPNELALLNNAKLYIMAEKYDVQPLKTLAHQKYAALAPSNWNSSSFVASLQILFVGTPEGDSLTAFAIKIASYHPATLVDRHDYAELCKGYGELSYEIMKAVVQRKGPVSSGPLCQTCGSFESVCVCWAPGTAVASPKSHATMASSSRRAHYTGSSGVGDSNTETPDTNLWPNTRSLFDS